jgi:hypothetical protein
VLQEQAHIEVCRLAVEVGQMVGQSGRARRCFVQEAAYICAGSSAAVMGMASKVQDDLWSSIQAANFGQYYRISDSMNLASSRREGRRQSIPLRVYIKQGRGAALQSPNTPGPSRECSMAAAGMQTRQLRCWTSSSTIAPCFHFLSSLWLLSVFPSAIKRYIRLEVHRKAKPRPQG